MTATTIRIRIRNGKAFTTDGPFAETKEQLGGFFLTPAASGADGTAAFSCNHDRGRGRAVTTTCSVHSIAFSTGPLCNGSLRAIL